MAIRTATNNTPAEEKPAAESAVEPEPETAAETVAEPEPEVAAESAVEPEVAAEPAAEPKAQPPAVKQVVGGGLTVGSSTEFPSFMQLRNALDPETYGNIFPRVVPASGILKTDSNVQLGTFGDVQVVSFSDRWMVTPVADMNKDPESKKYCRASYDGKTIPDRDGGEAMTIEQYKIEAAAMRKAAKKEPYAEWKVSKYMDVFGLIFNADPKFLEAALNLGMVQFSVSVTAIKAFQAFFIQGPLNVKRNRVPADKQTCMRISAKAIILDNMNYSIVIPDLTPLDVLAGYEMVSGI